jgi:hypothetical protein
MNYQQEIAFLAAVEKPQEPLNKRRAVTQRELDTIRKEHPGIPETYLAFLAQAGTGSFRECQFILYDTPATPDDVWVDNIQEKNIVFCGDNYSGGFFGFRLGKDEVIEFWRIDGEITATGTTFPEYIRKCLLMDEAGNDLRVK